MPQRGPTGKRRLPIDPAALKHRGEKRISCQIEAS